MIHNSLPTGILNMSIWCVYTELVHNSVCAYAHTHTGKRCTAFIVLFCANSCYGLFFMLSCNVFLRAQLYPGVLWI